MWGDITRGLGVLGFGAVRRDSYSESQSLFLKETDLIRPKLVTFCLLSFGLESPVSGRYFFSCSSFQLTHQGNMMNPQSTWLPAPNWASKLSLQPWSFLLQVKAEKMERKTWWILFSPSVRACLQPGDR